MLNNKLNKAPQKTCSYSDSYILTCIPSSACYFNSIFYTLGYNWHRIYEQVPIHQESNTTNIYASELHEYHLYFLILLMERRKFL